MHTSRDTHPHRDQVSGVFYYSLPYSFKMLSLYWAGEVTQWLEHWLGCFGFLFFFSRRARFTSQHPHSGSQWSVTFLEIQSCLLPPQAPGLQVTNKHICRQNTYTYEINTSLQNLSVNLKYILRQLDRLANNLPASTCLHPSQAQTAMLDFLHGCRGFKPRSLCIYSKHS